MSIGDVAGNLNKTDRYWQLKIDGIRIRCHRVVWCMHNGEIEKGFVIDHIDGNRSNNCISNLRIIPKKDNNRNSKMQRNNTSGVTGVGLAIGTRYGERYWVARWFDEIGKARSKSFSVNRLGEESAKENAISFRTNKIKEMISLGIDYTERHGKGEL